MSFPANLSKHRAALLEMLGEAVRDPARPAAMRTRGVSMRPFICANDEVRIRACGAHPPEPGDVIAFRSGDLLMVHRLVAVVEREDGPVLYEKGDANMYLAPIRPGAVLGVVTEVRTPSRTLRLDSARLRVLGRLVARYGLHAVSAFHGARTLGRRVARPGGLPSRLARGALLAVLRAPLAAALWTARQVL